MVRRMTLEQREGFLAEVRVGVLTVAAESDRAPLTTPIWYDYRPGGDVTVQTSPGLRKARLITEAGRFALCVHDDNVPYRYVTVEGPVVEVRPVTEQERFAMAARYMPEEIAAVYIEATRERQAGNVAITMRPDRWNTEDYADVVEQLSV
jgi:nitroimidazol reductase NimA-like FMN-containing flavoprotein (pyridoxamine 5'-phosphate oxidase superfamily)